MERWLVWSVLLKFVLFVNVNAWQWQLILKHDVPSGWNLDGAFSYYDWGEQLARLKPDLPPDFDYESFRRAQGLWVVLPAASKNESIATFGLNFRGKGTAFHNVNLTYSIGGNAKVYLMDGGNDTEPVYEIQPPSEQKFQLETVTIPITNLIPWVMTSFKYD